MKTSPPDKELKIGFIGLDSSHCIEYANLLNDPDNPSHVQGARAVAAFPGGSPDWELSYGRVDGFREELENKWQIRIEASVEAVAESVDAIMILSVDGRKHLDEFRRVARLGKPVYIDKPLATTVEEAQEILEISQETETRFFSTSVWRYTEAIRSACAHQTKGGFRHAYVNGQWPLQPGRHGWFWYGIHLVEILYSAMGRGCESVTTHRDGDVEIITGYWNDGRHGIMASNRPENRSFTGVFVGDSQSHLIQELDTKYDRYRAFLEDAVRFFDGGTESVNPQETLETIQFMDAAETSARQGRAVNLKPF